MPKHLCILSKSAFNVAVFLLTWLELIGTPSLAIAATPEAFNLSEAAPGVFVHRGRQLALDVPGHDDIANIGFVVGSKCVAVIDTGGSLRTGRALRTAIRRSTSLPICYVINTHVHVDHVLGNFAFKGDKPSFVGHATLAAALAHSRDFFVQQYAGDLDAPVTVAQIVAPDCTVEKDLDLDLGDRHLSLHAWPKAHTDSDLSVYDAKTGTLWAGDLLFRERLPALDGSVKGWLGTLDELSGMKVNLVVPGHGSTTHDLIGTIAAQRHYLQILLDGVRAELAQGKSMEDAVAHVGVAEQSHWLLWHSTHPRNVTRAYQELEWE